MASDTTTLTVAPDDPPIGAPVRTLIGYDEFGSPVGGIVIDGSTVPGTLMDLPGFYSPTLRTGYAVIDRMSREVLRAGTDDTYDLRDMRGVIAKFAGRPDILVIASSLPNRSDTQDATRALLGEIGVSVNSIDAPLIAAGAPWTAIGTPGAAPGTGFLNVGGELKDRRGWRPEDDFFCRTGDRAKCYPPDPTPPPNPCEDLGFFCAKDEPVTAHAGELTGYLTKGAGGYGFSFQEAVPFRVGTSGGSATTASMMVGGDEWKRPYAASGAFAGWNLVVLDGKNLVVRRSDVFVTSTASGAADAQRTSLVAALNQVQPGQLVMLHRDGGLCDTWRELRVAISRVGGRGEILRSCTGNPSYSFIGGIGLANSVDSLDDSLSGALMRSNDSRFVPVTAARTGRTSTELMEIAYQPASRWPYSETDGHRAADKWIASELALSSGRSIRENYYRNPSVDWNVMFNKLRDLAYPGDGNGFTSTQFDELKRSLLEEFLAVAQVNKYITNLQQPFNSAFSNYVDLLGVGNKVKDALDPPQKKVDTKWLSVISGASALLGKVADLTGNPGAGQGLAAIGQGFALVKTLYDKEASGPVFADRVAVASDQLAVDLVERYTQARDEFRTVGRLVMSDHDKLMLVSRKSTGDDGWRFDPADPLIELGLSKSARRWFYETLLPVGYKRWKLSGVSNARDWYCTEKYYDPSVSRTGARKYPFRSATDTVQYTADDGFLYVMGRVDGRLSDDDSAQPPPEPLIAPLLKPIVNQRADQGLGMSWADFLRVLPVQTPQYMPPGGRCPD